MWHYGMHRARGASRDGRVIDLRLLAPRRGERAIEPSHALALGRLSGHASFIPECHLRGVSSLSSGEVHSCVRTQYPDAARDGRVRRGRWDLHQRDHHPVSPRIPPHAASCRHLMQAPERALAAAGRVSGRASPWSLAAMGVEDEAWPWAFDAVWGSILAPQAQVFSRARSTVLFGKPAPHACPVQSFGGVPVPSGRQMSA